MSFWNDPGSTLPPTVVRDDSLDPETLAMHLGQVSQFVGLMDTIDKVREHLDAITQYETVRSNLLDGYTGQPEDDFVIEHEPDAPAPALAEPAATQVAPEPGQGPTKAQRLAQAKARWRGLVAQKKVAIAKWEADIAEAKAQVHAIEQEPG